MFDIYDAADKLKKEAQENPERFYHNKEQGYRDGLDGRPVTKSDPAYLNAYNQGISDRLED
jgi:hypothetical protein